MPNPLEPLFTEIVKLFWQYADELKRASQVVALYVLFEKLPTRGIDDGAPYCCISLLFPIVFETVTTNSLHDGDESIFDDVLMVNTESDTQRVCSPAERPTRALTEFEMVPREPLHMKMRTVPVDGMKLLGVLMSIYCGKDIG